MSARDHLDSDRGAYLLGRNRHPGDERDFPLERALETGSASALDLALAALLKSHASKATKAWAALATPLIERVGPAPAPIPTPPSPPAPNGAISWTDPETTLDQGDTGHCVGFGGSQWENTLPIDDRKTNADGHELYYSCKVEDGEPKAEDGSTVHSLAKVLQASGRLTTYAWASTIDAVIAWVTSHGPVVMGTDWYNDMFDPSPSGLVTPTGGVAGGHCYVCTGYDPATGLLEYLNSWSASWGVKGRFYLNRPAAAMLLGSDGAEAMAAVELPLAA